MAISRFDRRIRIVSFRLSEKEYRTLQEFCASHGLRGISDLARRAIQNWFISGGASAQLSMPKPMLIGRSGGNDPLKGDHGHVFNH
jgi:hypothetical protein